MRYYILRASRNRKEVGAKPQSQNCIFGDIQKDFIPKEGIIDFDFKLPEPILEKKAKQTSMISVVAIPKLFLVIEDSLLSFLKKFKIGNYQDWKIKTWQSKQLIEKYNLFLINDTKQAEYIDFENSEFYIGSYKDYKWEGDNINVLNHKDILESERTLKEENLLLKAKKIVLNFSNVSEDLFRMGYVVPVIGTVGYFVSEKLKTAIEDNGFTGMEFIEVSELDKVEVIY